MDGCHYEEQAKLL